MSVSFDPFSPEDEQIPVSAEESVRRELRNTEASHRSPWTILLICGGGIALIVFALMLPLIQQRMYLNKLQAQGAILGTTFSNTWGLHDWSVWLDDRIGFGLPLPVQVVNADFRNFPLDDATLQKITGWPDLEAVLFARADFSAENLARFVAQTPQLRSLQVISCPQITPEDIHQLRETYPRLQIEFRGTAMLGIRGYDSNRGCYVYHVQPFSAAAQAGLGHGDILTQFDGEKVESFEHLVELIGRHVPGDEVELLIYRRAQFETLTCQLGGWIE